MRIAPGDRSSYVDCILWVRADSMPLRRHPYSDFAEGHNFARSTHRTSACARHKSPPVVNQQVRISDPIALGKNPIQSCSTLTGSGLGGQCEQTADPPNMSIHHDPFASPNPRQVQRTLSCARRREFHSSSSVRAFRRRAVRSTAARMT